MTDKDKKTQASTDKDTSTSSSKDNPGKQSSPASEQSKDNQPKNTKVSATEAAKIAAKARASAESEKSSSASKAEPVKAEQVKSTPKKSATPKGSGPTAGRSAPVQTNQSGISKTGVLALIVALAAAGGVGGLYYYQQQQLQALSAQLNDKLESEQQSNNQRLSQDVETQINALKQSSQQSNRNLANQLTDKNEQQQKELLQQVEQLEGKISRITSQQPSNWRVFEAEYLLRMAARVIWLEHDVNTAISLLDDADARLASMKQSRFMPIRKLIREDKQMLNQLPEDNSQDILLALMALNDSTDTLLLKGADKKVEVAEEELELSDDIADWEQNLRISWERFKADFITVRDKYDKDEPLMEPQYQQHLLQNLQLKLQVSQWAVTQQQPELYRKSLEDIESWLSTYFKEDNEANRAFAKEINALKEQKIAIEYPQNLESQQALREMLDQNFSASTQALTDSDQNRPVAAAAEAQQQDQKNGNNQDDVKAANTSEKQDGEQ